MKGAPIVAGTDGSARAEIALKRAAELASALDAPVHVVTGYSISQASWIASANGVPVGDFASEEAVRRDAEKVVERGRAFLAELGVTAHAHTCAGDPGKALVTIADGHKAQMIVVGNRGMSGARRMLGSVPNYVSHHAGCGVLIVPTG